MSEIAIGDFDMIPNAGGVGPTGNALVSADNITVRTFNSVPGRIDIFSSTTALTQNTQYLIVIDDSGSSTAFNTGDIYRATVGAVAGAGSSFSGAALVTGGVVGATRTFATSDNSNVDISIFEIGTTPSTLTINNSTNTQIFSLDDNGT